MKKRPELKLIVGNEETSSVKIGDEEMLRIQYTGITESNYRGKRTYYDKQTHKPVILIPMDYVPYFVIGMREAVKKWADQQRIDIQSIEDCFYADKENPTT